MADSKLRVVNTNQNVENLSESLRDIIRDRLLEHLEASRAERADVGVQVEADHLGNQDKLIRANKLYEMALTAVITENDLCKAERLLIQSSKVCPREAVTMMLAKVRSEIAHISGPIKPSKVPRTSEPNVEVVDKFVEIAKNAIAAKDFEKAVEFLNRAEKVKPTVEAQQLLKEVKILIDKRKKENQSQAVIIPEQIVEHATKAIEADEYDVAELLLMTAWIQYKNESAKQMLDAFIQSEGLDLDQNIRCTKFLVNRPSYEQSSACLEYSKLAEIMIAQGQLKIAELMLILASHIRRYYQVENSNENQLMRKMHSSLYTNKCQYNVKAEWTWQKHELPHEYESIEDFKCSYFLRMAYRAFYYAENPKLAQDFLMAARKYSFNNESRNFVERCITEVNKKL